MSKKKNKQTQAIIKISGTKEQVKFALEILNNRKVEIEILNSNIAKYSKTSGHRPGQIPDVTGPSEFDLTGDALKYSAGNDLGSAIKSTIDKLTNGDSFRPTYLFRWYNIANDDDDFLSSKVEEFLVKGYELFNISTSARSFNGDSGLQPLVLFTFKRIDPKKKLKIPKKLKHK